MKLTSWAGDGHGVPDKMIVGGDNGSTQLSSDRCDPEPDFMKWLFAQKLRQKVLKEGGYVSQKENPTTGT